MNSSATDAVLLSDTSSNIFASEVHKLLWAAAFFDGEGCVHLSTQGRVQVIIHNTNKEALKVLQSIEGGTITRHNGTNKRIYRLRLQGWRAIRFLEKILPYSIVKKDAIAAAIEFYKNGRKDLEEYRKRVNTTLQEK